MKKICFISDGIEPKQLLNTFKKMTPNSSGIWNNIQGVESIKDADFFAVIDRTNNPDVPINKCIFLGAHPPCLPRAYSDMSKYSNAIKCYDLKYTFGFAEWWINFSYDDLLKLEPPKKTKSLACILTDRKNEIYQRKRLMYMDEFCKLYPDVVDLYGRVNPTDNMKKSYKGVCGNKNIIGDYWSGKESVYNSYKYCLEFDARPSQNYFSERIFDALLLWCMPIIWGSDNIHEYLPEKSFCYLDIDKNGTDVIDILNDDPYEKSIEYIKEARQLLLNKYQIWPRVYDALVENNLI